MNQDQIKPLILLVPHYLGSLKYYEKLMPLLASQFNTAFLFLPKIRTKAMPEMENYCRDRRLTFYSVPKGADKSTGGLADVVGRRRFVKALGSLLDDLKPQKVVMTSDSDFFHDSVVRTCRRRGVESLLLQWAVALDSETKQIMDSELSLKNLSMTAGGSAWRSHVGRWVRRISGVGSEYARQFASGRADRVGVINKYSFEVARQAGVPLKRVAVVGHLDLDAAVETKKNYDLDPAKARALAVRLGLESGKKTISVFASTPFYTKDMRIMTAEAQLDYYRRLFGVMMSVCSPEDYNFCFKIHPAESLELYRPLESIGAKLFDKNTANDDLIYCADLYVSHHTTTNFMAMAMGKDCLFLNLVGLKFIDRFKAVMSIDEFIPDWSVLQQRLQEWRAGEHRNNYRVDDIMTDVHSGQRISRWVAGTEISDLQKR